MKLKTKKIYIFKIKDENTKYDGWIKIGETHREDVRTRIKEQEKGTIRHNLELLYECDAYDKNGVEISDHDIHYWLDKKNVKTSRKYDKETLGNDWAMVTLEKAIDLINAIKNHQIQEFDINRTKNFTLRKEQKECIFKTSSCFLNNKVNKFLWNAKMRFGKTFTTYKLIEKMGFKRILITTFMPAVEDSWNNDLLQHIDFKGWNYINADTPDLEKIDLLNNSPNIVIYFASLQDLLGKKDGKIKLKNELLHKISWDLIVFDEYHFGAWRDKTKQIVSGEYIEEEIDNIDTNESQEESFDRIRKENEELEKEYFPLKTKYKLYLSGTPYRAIAIGEFVEFNTFSWTYLDEQRAKENWDYTISKTNPYEILPKMTFFTYKLPLLSEAIRQSSGKNEFELNEFFKAEKIGDLYKFKYEEYVKRWLDMLIFKISPVEESLRNKGIKEPYTPFKQMREELKHTFWLFSRVSSCEAMYNLLKSDTYKSTFYGQCEIVQCYGKYCGNGKEALIPVRKAINSGKQTITLSCGKLTLGVTIPEWTGALMLFDSIKPEKYMQAAFRIQSPYYKFKADGTIDIIKKNCYVFDFAPNRTLLQLREYEICLDRTDRTPTEKLQEFLKFLPVIAFDGQEMIKLNADSLITMATIGTTSSALANRFKSYRLINLSLDVLKHIEKNNAIQEILDKIEVFRKNETADPLKIIISREENIHKLKTKAVGGEITNEEKQKLNDEKKIQNKIISQAKQKLLTLLSRLPIFMYVNDFREETLEHVIEFIEPRLFEQVLGITINDFKLLKSIRLFDNIAMNETVLLFRLFEEESLRYIIDYSTNKRIQRNKNKPWGLFNMKISKNDVEELKLYLSKQ